MKSTKPKVATTYVEARDAETGRRVCRTYYETTPEEVIGKLDEQAKPNDPRPRRREKIPA